MTKDNNNSKKVWTQRHIKSAYRSGLEDKIADQLNNQDKVKYTYESVKISYLQPEKHRKYTPDFILSNGIIIETKGRFVSSDRMKHLLIKEQLPNLDIRFVFSNSNSRIYKNSKTTYATWCVKHGFKYADKLIPEEWLNE